MISRGAETEIKTLLHEFPVVGLTGPRQAGKTSLAKAIGVSLDKPSMYLDLENPDDLAKLQDPVLFLTAYADHCVILDEIQRMPGLFPVMRSLIDMKRIPGRFLILGSASPQLVKNSAESLAGRIIYKELMPFHWLEVNQISTIEKHWLRGGFPESFLAKDDTSSFRWRRSFMRTYIERDLPMLGLQTDLMRLYDFVTMLASSQGSIWKAESYAKSLGVSGPVIRRYLYYLENAYLIYVLQPFFMNAKKRVVKSPKVYIRDSGLLHAQLGFTSIQEIQQHTIAGYSWEGYVVSQIRAMLPEPFQLYYYRTHQGAEADLVIAKGGVPVHTLEIKYSNAPQLAKGFMNVISDLNTRDNFFITPSSDTYPVAETVATISLQNFLEQKIKHLA